MELKIKLSTEEMQEVIDAAVEAAREREYVINEDELIMDMCHIIDAALSAMGIEVIENEDENEDEDDDDDEEEMESIIYDCDGRRGISISDARLLMACVAKTLSGQFYDAPQELIEALIRIESLRIAKDYGIEVVDIPGE